ncbi:hypothetical protein C0993_000823, partial [Termitomyces sp. T159_Od127]
WASSVPSVELKQLRPLPLALTMSHLSLYHRLDPHTQFGLDLAQLPDIIRTLFLFDFDCFKFKLGSLSFYCFGCFDLNWTIRGFGHVGA